MPTLEQLDAIRHQIKQYEKERDVINTKIHKLEKQLEAKLQKLSESLGYSLVPSKTGTARLSSAKAAKAAKKKGSRAPAKIKYRDAQGNSWTGRGIKPKWLQTALNSGRRIEDFAV